MISHIVHHVKHLLGKLFGIDCPNIFLGRQSTLIAEQRQLDGEDQKSEYNFTMVRIETLVWVSGHGIIDRIAVVLGGTDSGVRFACVAPAE